MALIIDANTPTCCGGCFFLDYDTNERPRCFLCGADITKNVREQTKHTICPILGEIPDSHGDLIDRGLVQEVLAQLLPLVITNELTDKEIGLVHRTVGAIAEMINEQEVVVEATE